MYDISQKRYYELNYRQGLFSEESIDRIIDNFKTLTKSIHTNPNQNITELTILSKKDRALLDKWNNTKTTITYNKDFASLFEAQAIKTPNSIALDFDASIWEIIMSLFSGAALVICNKETTRDPEKLEKLIDTNKVTIATLPPTMLSRLSDNMKYLHTIISVGESCPVEVAEKWIKTVTHFFNGYGPTETTICAAIARIKKNPNKPLINIPIGKPIPNFEAYILDAYQKLLPVGAVGELYISGIGLARGYVNKKETDEICFINNPFKKDSKFGLYRTGDLARWTDDGNLEFHGRKDRQIKLSGYRIELEEIEQVIKNCPLVKDCAVICIKNDSNEQSIIAFIITGKQDKRLKSLQAFLKARLPVYMIPSQFLFRDTIPLTPNKKIDLNALKKIAQKQNTQSIIPPQNPIVQSLLEIWQDVLGVKKIGVHDNFFSIGGHSLKMTQVTSRIRDVFNIEFPIKLMFDYLTISDLAQYIKKQLNVNIPVLPAPLRTIKKKTALPLSYSQERIWFIHQLEPESIAYNIILSLKLKGPLDVVILEKAYQKVVNRHEILRTTFPQKNDQPIQKIHPKMKGFFKYIDLHPLPILDSEKEAFNYANMEAKHLFNLQTGPLIRLTHIRINKDSNIIIFNMHHIISDLWSVGNLTYEIKELYESMLYGRKNILDELPIQYSDFTLWQRKHLTPQKLSREINYWKNQLSDLPVLMLPQDRPRPVIQTYIGSYITIPIENELIQKLKSFSIKQNTSTFMILLSCYYILLSKYTGTTDIPVGTPIANRNHSVLEKQMGTFVNTLVLRTSLNNNPTVAELLKRVKSVCLEAFTYQNLTFEKLVKELNPGRDLNHLPLAQVLFNMANTPIIDNFLTDIKWEIYELSEIGVQFDLTLTIELEIMKKAFFYYNSDLFDHDTIQQVARHYFNIVKQIIQNPDQKINQISILSKTEYKQITTTWNSTAANYPDTRLFPQIFENREKKHKNKTAIYFNKQSISYTELNRKANKLARYLRSKNTGPEKIIGIYVNRSPDLIISLLAIMKAGGAYLPLDPGYPVERLNFMLKNSKAHLLLTHSNLKENLNFHSEKIICMDYDHQLINKFEHTNLQSELKPENMAYVIYTSGSTGIPKGVEIPYRSLNNFLYSMKNNPGINSNDHLLAITPISFDISCLELFLPLFSGATITLADTETTKDGNMLTRLINDTKPTIMQATPTTWQILIESGWHNSSINKLLCGGEPLPSELADKLLDQAKKVWNLYGPTETTIWSTIYPVQYKNSPVLIGKPIANTNVYVLDPHNNPVPIGVSGELHIGGKGLARGYLNDNV